MPGVFDDLFDGLEAPSGRVNIRRDLTQRVATVMDSARASQLYLAFMRGLLSEAEFNAGLEECILEHGMSKAEIEAAFPPDPRHADQLSFNRTSLIATILWQEWQWVGKRRPPGNVRHFWYTNLMYTLMRIMGDKNIPTIFVTYNKVLSTLVRHEGFRYADLNLTSNKSELCEAVFTDSPYPHIILACEKESYHDHLKKLARIFRITFISLGGQGSYKVYEDLVVDLLNAGIDLQQEFHVLVVSDYDPQGYCIQDTVKAHLERAGLAHVTVHRVYLRPEHITEGIVEHHGIPYVWRKNTPQATRGALTLYTEFGRRTGGIYKRQGAWRRFDRNGDGHYDVPVFTDATDGYELYRVELDNFRDEVLLELLIDALEPFIDGADYYYAKARELWRQAFRRRLPEAAKAVIQEAARRKYGAQRLRMRALRDRLQEKFAELSADEDTLIEQAEEDGDVRVDQLQSEIDAIQEEIDRLEGQKAELEAAQEDVQATAADIRDFLRHIQRLKAGEVVELEHQLESVEDVLTDYEAAQESALAEEVTSQFHPDRLPIQRIVDFSPRTIRRAPTSRQYRWHRCWGSHPFLSYSGF
jgi:hypothetical protein